MDYRFLQKSAKNFKAWQCSVLSCAFKYSLCLINAAKIIASKMLEVRFLFFEIEFTILGIHLIQDTI